MTRSSSRIAAGLSLVIPGLSQVYNGEYAKGGAILATTAGIWAGILITKVGPVAFRSWLSSGFLVLVYPFILIPAIRDAYRQGSGQPGGIGAGERAWYVILMLLAVGPLALPLLWQSGRFSRKAKIAFTTGVILVAVIMIYLLVVLGPVIEELLKQAVEVRSPL
jgi:hypothetical protein